MSMAAAQAADLPSRKSAPAQYVKICDAYGAGFFYSPGTDTCLKVGGYVRFEVQATPGTKNYAVTPAGAYTLAQVAGTQDTTGDEVRGRVDLDARTQSEFGTVRTVVSLRGTSSSGLRGATTNYATSVTAANLGGSSSSLTMEKAYIQFAGFTFGVASENYAMMPSSQYSGNPWAGFPNGMRQIAYTAVFGGGVSATVAIEDRQFYGYNTQIINNAGDGYELVGNVRIDQGWGFAAIHGMMGQSSFPGQTSSTSGGIFDTTPSTTLNPVTGTVTSKFGYAIGATAKINLPMLAAGDALWLTANYVNGQLGGILGSGSLDNMSSSSGARILGGVYRQDFSVTTTGGAGTLANPYTYGNTTGWNVAAELTHYWAPKWRSNFTAGYIEFNPATAAAASVGQAWGTGQLWEVLGQLIWSPVKDFDIGVELQYASIRNQVQNLPVGAGTTGVAGWVAAGKPGLNSNNISAKLRLERTF